MNGVFMTNEITGIESIVTLPMAKDQIIERFKAIQSLKMAILDDSDMIKIGNKPYVLKSGWRKLEFALNLTDTIMREEKEVADGITTWRIQVKVIAPNGRAVMGIGACSSNERKFQHPDHDVYAMSHTRAKNRAISDMCGLGEVSAEEMTAETEERQEIIPKISDKQKDLIKNLAAKVNVIVDSVVKTTLGPEAELDNITRPEASLVIDALKKMQKAGT